MIRRPPRSTLFPTRRSSDLNDLVTLLRSRARDDPKERPTMLLRGGRRLGQAPLVTLYRDRKSTRLNSSHPSISYAVFCLKKKNTPQMPHPSAIYKSPPPRPP